MQVFMAPWQSEQKFYFTHNIDREHLAQFYSIIFVSIDHCTNYKADVLSINMHIFEYDSSYFVQLCLQIVVEISMFDCYREGHKPLKVKIGQTCVLRNGSEKDRTS
jgi:hypothetical protein